MGIIFIGICLCCQSVCMSHLFFYIDSKPPKTTQIDPNTLTLFKLLLEVKIAASSTARDSDFWYFAFIANFDPSMTALSWEQERDSSSSSENSTLTFPVEWEGQGRDRMDRLDRFNDHLDYLIDPWPLTLPLTLDPWSLILTCRLFPGKSRRSRVYLCDRHGVNNQTGPTRFSWSRYGKWGSFLAKCWLSYFLRKIYIEDIYRLSIFMCCKWLMVILND